MDGFCPMAVTERGSRRKGLSEQEECRVSSGGEESVVDAGLGTPRRAEPEESVGPPQRRRAGQCDRPSFGNTGLYRRNRHKPLPGCHRHNPTKTLQVAWTPATPTSQLLKQTLDTAKDNHSRYPRAEHLFLGSIYLLAVPNDVTHAHPSVHPPSHLL